MPLNGHRSGGPDRRSAGDAARVVQRFRPLSKGKHVMKKIDVDKDYKSSKFLIVAMIIQIIVVFFLLVAYTTWLRW
jgi:hypothetical protein